MNAIRSGRRRLVASLLAALLPALLAILLAVGMIAGGCGSDDDSSRPVRPVRLPPTTISEGEPPPRIQEQPRPVDPLPPPSEQP